jgi:hypothetical protein
MRGVYTVTMKNVTLVTTGPTAQTLVFINPGSTASLRLLRAWCGQGGSASPQNLDVALVSQPTGFPTLTSTAPVAISIIDPAAKITGGTAGAAGTAGTNASAEGSGTKSILIYDSFNNLNGWVYVPTPEERITFSASGSTGLGLYLATAATSATNWTAGIEYEEI